MAGAGKLGYSWPMTHDSAAIVVFVLLDIALFSFFFRVIFGDIDTFLNSIAYIFTPDWISALRGQMWDDLSGSIRLLLFFALCAGTIGLEKNSLESMNTPPPQPAVHATARPHHHHKPKPKAHHH